MFTDHGEIQKYRKLTENEKKKEGESYLIKERQRRMQYYKPSRELTRTQRIKRNKKNKETLRKWCQKKKEEKIQQDQRHGL